MNEEDNKLVDKIERALLEGSITERDELFPLRTTCCSSSSRTGACSSNGYYGGMLCTVSAGQAKQCTIDVRGDWRAS